MGEGPGGFAMKARHGFKFVFMFFAASWLLSACSTTERNNTYHPSDSSRETRPLVDDKYRLTADREKLNEMRSEEPQEKQVENDESAFLLQLMSDPSRSPSDVREKFDTALRKKREKFQKDMQKERDEFTKKEQKNRDLFLKGMDTDRKDFLKSKHGKDERDEFFNNQDEKRKDYFETQRERRSDFEADVSDRRKDFEDYARSKSNEFLQEWRAFQRRHDEYEKSKNANSASGLTTPSPTPAVPTPQPEVKSFLQEFMDIPQTPGTNLESGD